MFLMTPQELYDAVQRILGQSISDVEKAAQIRTLRDSQFKDDEYMAMLTGYSLADVKAYLALADEPEPVYDEKGLPVLTPEQIIYFPTNADAYNKPSWGGGIGWERGPDRYEYMNTGTPLVYNVTLVDRLYSTYFDEYQTALASQVLSIINNAAENKSNPSAALMAINNKHDNFASKFINAIGLTAQIVKYTGNGAFYIDGQPASIPPDIMARMQQYGTSGSKSPLNIPANQPPLSPTDIKTGVTTPIRPTTPTPVTVTPGTPAMPTPVTVTPGTPATPTPAAGSNIGLLIGAAALALLLG